MMAKRLVMKSVAAPRAMANSACVAAMPTAAMGGTSATAMATPTRVPARPGRASA